MEGDSIGSESGPQKRGKELSLSTRAVVEQPFELPSRFGAAVLIGRTPDVAGVLRRELGRATIFALDGVVHFLSVYGNILRRIDAQTDFVPANVDDRDNDIVPDHDAFVAVSRQNEHRLLLAGCSNGQATAFLRAT
jgi:hypothetical protein